MSSADYIRLFGAIALWLVAMIFGLLPLKTKAFRTNKMLIAISNSFAGGLFLAVGLIHLLPEAQEFINAALDEEDDPHAGHNHLEGDVEEGHNHPFPLTQVIAVGTFCLVLLIDKVLFNNHDISHNESVNLSKSIIKKDDADESTEHFKEIVSSRYKVAINSSRRNMHTEDCKSLKNDDEGGRQESEEDVFDKEIQHVNPNRLTHNHHHHHGHTHATVQKGDGIMISILLLTALSIHSLFAGMAFGLASTQAAAIDMFIALISHKWSEVLMVGISFVNARIEFKRAFFLILYLSFVTPLGVLIGYLISGLNSMIVGVFTAISAGTFIYIATTEIIVEEFSIKKLKTVKFIFLLLGIVFVVLIGLLE